MSTVGHTALMSIGNAAGDERPPRKSLVSKLAEVMKAVGRVPKRGRNEFHRYDYATEADIAEAIRAELADRDVVLIPSITGESRHPVGEKGSVLTVLEMEMEFCDGETGESIKKPWRGYGTDKEDKGGYKAMTGGEKYFLLKTFLLPTGDDPEEDTTTHPQAQENRRAFEARKAAQPPRPAPPTHDPLDGPLPDGHTRVASVTEKKGTGKNGKPYTKYTVVDSNGEEYGTFSASLAKVAVRVRDEGTPVDLRFETDKYGKNLIEIVTIGREPGEEG